VEVTPRSACPTWDGESGLAVMCRLRSEQATRGISPVALLPPPGWLDPATGEQCGVLNVVRGSVPGDFPRPLFGDEHFEVVW
jgi:hypothetical protein